MVKVQGSKFKVGCRSGTSPEACSIAERWIGRVGCYHLTPSSLATEARKLGCLQCSKGKTSRCCKDLVLR